MAQEAERRLEPNQLLAFGFTQLQPLLRMPRRLAQLAQKARDRVAEDRHRADRARGLRAARALDRQPRRRGDDHLGAADRVGADGARQPHARARRLPGRRGARARTCSGASCARPAGSQEADGASRRRLTRRSRRAAVASTEPASTSAKPSAMPKVRCSLEDRHAEHGGDGRVDVGDHGRPHRPDLRDQLEEDDERERRADDREREHRRGDLPARHARRAARTPRTARRSAPRSPIAAAIDAERRRVAQPAREHDRPDRVTDRDDRDLGERQRAGAVHVEPDDRGDADASRRSSPAQRRAPCRSRSPVNVVTTAPTSGTAAISRPVSELVSSRLGAREEEPRDHDLDHREDEHRQPAARERPQLTAQGRDRQQQRARRSPCG